MSWLSSFVNGITGQSAQKAASQAHDDANAATAQANTAMQPFVDVGIGGINGLNALMNNPSQALTSLPSYQFALNQGLESINRTAAASGFRGSGNVLQELTKYATGLASQTYADEFNRRYNLAALGSNAAAKQATNTLQGADSANSILFQGGRDQAAIQNNLLNQGMNIFGKLSMPGTGGAK